MSHGRHIARSRFVNGSPEAELWDDLDQFYKDHLAELNAKLDTLDDSIWGKAVLMERNRRIAKAYLRQSRLIVDGGQHEFDGKQIGWNSFSNSHRDPYGDDLRSKIGEGVVITMDCRGSVWAMARGTTPVFVQGWKERDKHCFGDRVCQQQGRLATVDPFKQHGEEDKRAIKIFDMTTFKRSVELELTGGSSSAVNRNCSKKELLFKTCMRIALVKDGHFPAKTPCWFLIINLVALDMLNSQMPIAGILDNLTATVSVSGGATAQRHSQRELTPPSATSPSSTESPQTPVVPCPPATSPTQPDSQTAATLSQLLAATAAITQQQQQAQPTANGYLSEADSIVSMYDAQQPRRPKSSHHRRIHHRSPMAANAAHSRQSNQSMDCVYEEINSDADDEFQANEPSRKAVCGTLRNFTLSRPNSEVYTPINLKKTIAAGGARNGFLVKKWSCSSLTSDYDSSSGGGKGGGGGAERYDSSNYSTASRSSAGSTHSARLRATCSSPSFLSDVNSEYTTTTADSGFNDSTQKRQSHVSGTLPTSVDPRRRRSTGPPSNQPPPNGHSLDHKTATLQQTTRRFMKPVIAPPPPPPPKAASQPALPADLEKTEATCTTKGEEEEDEAFPPPPPPDLLIGGAPSTTSTPPSAPSAPSANAINKRSLVTDQIKPDPVQNKVQAQLAHTASNNDCLTLSATTAVAPTAPAAAGTAAIAMIMNESLTAAERPSGRGTNTRHKQPTSSTATNFKVKRLVPVKQTSALSTAAVLTKNCDTDTAAFVQQNTPKIKHNIVNGRTKSLIELWEM